MLLKTDRRIVTKEIALADRGSLLCDWVNQGMIRILENAAKEGGIERRMSAVLLWSKVKRLRDARSRAKH